MKQVNGCQVTSIVFLCDFSYMVSVSHFIILLVKGGVKVMVLTWCHNGPVDLSIFWALLGRLVRVGLKVQLFIVDLWNSSWQNNLHLLLHLNVKAILCNFFWQIITDLGLLLTTVVWHSETVGVPNQTTFYKMQCTNCFNSYVCSCWKSLKMSLLLKNSVELLNNC